MSTKAVMPHFKRGSASVRATLTVYVTSPRLTALRGVMDMTLPLSCHAGQRVHGDGHGSARLDADHVHFAQVVGVHFPLRHVGDAGDASARRGNLAQVDRQLCNRAIERREERGFVERGLRLGHARLGVSICSGVAPALARSSRALAASRCAVGDVHAAWAACTLSVASDCTCHNLSAAV